MTMRNFVHHGKPVSLLVPTNLSATPVEKVASMRNYQGAFLYVAVGALGDAVSLTLRQAKNVEKSGIKNLVFTEYYVNNPTMSPATEEDKWEKKSSSGASLTIAATDDSKQYVIPIRPGMLDVNNDYDCVGITLSAGAGTDLVVAVLFLHDGPMGITDSVQHIPSARVNRMPN